MVSEPIQSRLHSLNEETLRNLDDAKKIRHPGESGRAREDVIARLIRTLVPRSFDVSTGFVIDATGAMSKQIDIIIARNDYHPVFEVGGVKYFMVESVAAVLENKSSITSKQVLHEALENIRSVKALDRTNRGKNYTLRGTDRGPDVDLQKNYRLGIYGAIVTEESLNIETLRDELLTFFRTNRRDYWPNQYVDARHFSIHYASLDTEAKGVHMMPIFAKWLIVTDQTLGPFTPPLIELTTELLGYIRVMPVIDYNPLDYLLPKSMPKQLANLDLDPSISPRTKKEEKEKGTGETGQS